MVASWLFLFHSGTSHADFRDSGDDESVHWGWVGQLGDYYVGGQSTVGGGVGAFLYLSENSILSLEAGTGTNIDFWSSIGGDTVNGYNERLGFYFSIIPFGHTFYFKVGPEVRQITFNVVHYPPFGNGENYSQTADVDVLSLYLGLGNRWNIRRLAVGCDWVAATLPLGNWDFRETDTGTSYDGWDLKSRLTRANLVLTRAYIGMNF